MNALDEVRQVFDDRNMFLQVALGLVSASLRFEALLREEVNLAPRPTIDVEDPALDAVLGVVAFTQRVLRHAEAAAQARRVEARSVSGDLALPSGSHRLGSGLLR